MSAARRPDGRTTGLGRLGRGGKLHGNYSSAIDRRLYAQTPKAVFAALAVSLLTNHSGIEFEDLSAAILNEWGILHVQGLVPQRPPALGKVVAG